MKQIFTLMAVMFLALTAKASTMEVTGEYDAQSKTILVNLHNEVPVTSFTFKFALPAGTTLAIEDDEELQWYTNRLPETSKKKWTADIRPAKNAAIGDCVMITCFGGPSPIEAGDGAIWEIPLDKVTPGASVKFADVEVRDGVSDIKLPSFNVLIPKADVVSHCKMSATFDLSSKTVLVNLHNDVPVKSFTFKYKLPFGATLAVEDGEELQWYTSRLPETSRAHWACDIRPAADGYVMVTCYNGPSDIAVGDGTIWEIPLEKVVGGTVSFAAAQCLEDVNGEAVEVDMPNFYTTLPSNGTIVFDSNGGSAVASIVATVGSAITAPAAPTKTGYTFVGWEPALPSTMPAGTTTVKAKWEAITYNVTVSDTRVSVSNKKPTYGSDVVVTVSESPYYVIDKLKVNGTDVTASIVNGSYTIKSIKANVTISATFRTEETITLTSEYMTFSCNKDLDFTNSSIEAYIVCGFNKAKNAVTLLRVTEVPAGTGVLLVGVTGTVEKFPFIESTCYYNSMLEACLAKTTITASSGSNANYTLKTVNGVPGFYPVAGSVSMAAKSAYLQVPASLSAGAKVNIIFEDGATIDAVNSISADQNVELYDMNGRKLNANDAQHGLFIQNGQKIWK